MIVGTGVDIAEVGRIQAAIEQHGDRFLNRVYTSGEIAYCESHRGRFERYAARFAAKEAAMKALGTGWSRGVRWVDIEVARQRGSRPTLLLHGAAGEHGKRLGVSRISLSLTHTDQIAFAEVILED